MTTLYNVSGMKDRRRDLRKRQTPQEIKFWDFCRSRGCAGVKFRRQYSVGRFVLDFYCPKLKLAVEIDGPIHNRQKEYDSFRQSGIEAIGIRFIRFTNHEIDNEFEAVEKRIREEIRISSRPAATLLLEKEKEKTGNKKGIIGPPSPFQGEGPGMRL